MATPNTNSSAILSTSFSIPSGAYRGIVFAEDRSRGARRAFCEPPHLRSELTGPQQAIILVAIEPVGGRPFSLVGYKQ